MLRYDDNGVLKETKLLGFQICNAQGENIQGDPQLDMSSGFNSYDILAPNVAVRVIDALGPNFRLGPIFEGDIEEPEFVESLNEKAFAYWVHRLSGEGF